MPFSPALAGLAEKARTHFRSWVTNTASENLEETGRQTVFADILSCFRTGGDERMAAIPELHTLLEQDTPFGLKVLAHLAGVDPSEPMIPRMLASAFLQIIQKSAGAVPKEMHALCLGAAINDLDLAGEASAAGEVIFMLARESLDDDERKKLFQLAAEILKGFRESTIAPARKNAFLAHAMLDVALSEAPDRQKALLFEAAGHAKRALKVRPDFSFGLLVEGSVQLALGDILEGSEKRKTLRKAIRSFEKALALVSGDFDSLVGLGNALVLLADTLGDIADPSLLDRAETAFSAALDINPQSPAALTGLGNVHAVKADRTEGDARRAALDRARAQFEKALRTDPSSAQALQGLGNVALTIAERVSGTRFTEALDQAEASFSRILEQNNDDLNALAGAGSVWRLRARTADRESHQAVLAEASRAFNRILNLEPDRLTALHALGAISRTQALDLDGGERHRKRAEAIGYYDRALAVAPNDHVVLLSRAHTRFDQMEDCDDRDALEKLLAETASDYEAAITAIPASRTPINAYSALIHRYDRRIHELEIDDCRSFERLTEHCEHLRQVRHRFHQENAGDRRARLEGQSWSETTIASGAHAAWRLGDTDRAVAFLETGLALQVAEGLGIAADQTIDFDPTHVSGFLSAPLVYLCAAEATGLAFLVSSKTTKVIELAGARRDAVLHRVGALMDGYDRFRGELSDHRLRRSDRGQRWTGDGSTDSFSKARRRWQKVVAEHLRWLGDTIIKPISLELDVLGANEVYLIPQGFFSFSPLHAALLDDNRPAFTEICFHYLPAGRIAQNLRTPRPRSAPPRLAALVDPHYRLDANPPLVAGRLEGTYFHKVKAGGQLEDQSQILCGEAACFRIDGDCGLPPEALSECNILHLSCHARAVVDDPDESALILAGDQVVTASDLLRDFPLSSLDMAMLSCCEGSARGRHAMDEGISLLSAFLEGGVASVVGAMWSVPDQETAEFTTRFYEKLLGDGDCRFRPARALQLAAVDAFDHGGLDDVDVWAAFQAAGR